MSGRRLLAWLLLIGAAIMLGVEIGRYSASCPPDVDFLIQ